MAEPKLPNAENPEKLLDLKRSSPEDAAGGLSAVLISARHVVNELEVGRGVRALRKLNQKDGFDCPGCAWPDPDDERSSLGEFCENGVKAIAEEATSKKLTAEFFKNHSVQQLSELSDYEIGKLGRVAEPVYLAPGATHYVPMPWDDVFNLMASHLNGLDSPNEAIFYTSGRTSNEAAFLYQLFVREFGTNNLPDCSNMCHESSGVALTQTIGTGKGTVTLGDFNHA
jgi:anaerobic selenocysteine-containing dehydrogenase